MRRCFFFNLNWMMQKLDGNIDRCRPKIITKNMFVNLLFLHSLIFLTFLHSASTCFPAMKLCRDPKLPQDATLEYKERIIRCLGDKKIRIKFATFGADDSNFDVSDSMQYLCQGLDYCHFWVDPKYFGDPQSSFCKRCLNIMFNFAN